MNRRLDSVEDQKNGVVTYELSNGQRIRLDARAVADYGAPELLRWAGLGHLLPAEWLPVMHHGQRIGIMSPDFDPARIRSRNYFYDPRPGDFTRDGNTWVAARTLGPGDVDAVVGFLRDHR